MASRFVSCVWYCHIVPYPLTASSNRPLHFESWELKNTRQHLFNSSKGWPLNNPFGPSPSGQGAHHISRLLDLTVGGVGLGRGWGSGPLGAATRCPRRRRPFNFFSRLGLFWRFGRFGFCRTGRRRTTKPGSPQTPIPRTENRQNFIAKIFFGDFNKHAQKFIAVNNI